MAYSIARYVGDGTTKTFSVPFPYLKREFIKVYVNGEPVTGLTWNSPNQVSLPNPPPEGSVVTVARETSLIRLLRFRDASMLKEENLDLDSDQLMALVQEMHDRTNESLRLGLTGEWDALGKRIQNVGRPKESGDAVNLGYLDDVIGGRLDELVAQVEDNVRKAKEAAEEASQAADIAVAAESNAEAYETLAKKWAEEDEHVYVEPGRFSAKHWAHIALEAVGRLMAGAKFEIPLLAPDGSGYHLQVTSAGMLRTVPADVVFPEDIVLVASDGSRFRINVNNNGDIYTVPASVPVPDVLDEVTLFAPNGWVYAVRVTPEGHLYTERTEILSENHHITMIAPSGSRFHLYVEDDGTIITKKEDNPT